MQISRRILVACVTTAILFPTFLRAGDTEAQIKARQALEQKMNELVTQPAPQAPARPVAPAPVPTKKAKPAVKPVPTVQPSPAEPAVKPKAQPLPQAAPGASGAIFMPVPEASSGPDAEKARAALRQKMNEMQQPPAAIAAPGEPAFQAVPGDASPAVTVMTKPQSEKAAKSEPNPKKLKAEKAEKPQPVVTTKSPAAFPPMQGPPTGLSADKEQRLQQLLQEYRADKLSPDEYHVQRAKILAEP
jgi:hypothetical protein